MNAHRFPWISRIELFKLGTGIKIRELNFNTSSLEMKEEALSA